MGKINLVAVTASLFILISFCAFDSGENSSVKPKPINDEKAFESFSSGFQAMLEGECVNGGFPYRLGPSQTAEENREYCLYWYNDSHIYIELQKFDMANSIRRGIFNKIQDDTPDDYFFVFWGKDSGWPSDIDTSAMALVVYFEERIDPDVEGQFLGFREDNGLFWTYFDFNFFPEPGNSKDCACNAAALLYYARNNIRFPKICAYLNNLSPEEMNVCDTHYPDYMLLYYLARAYAVGNQELEASKERNISLILDRQQEDGGWGEPGVSAFMLAALRYYDYQGPEVYKAMEYMFEHQGADGTWEYALVYYSAPYYSGDKHYMFSKYWPTAIMINCIDYYYDTNTLEK